MANKDITSRVVNAQKAHAMAGDFWRTQESERSTRPPLSFVEETAKETLKHWLSQIEHLSRKGAYRTTFFVSSKKLADAGSKKLRKKGFIVHTFKITHLTGLSSCDNSVGWKYVVLAQWD